MSADERRWCCNGFTHGSHMEDCPEICHCGKWVHRYDDGFTRGMCEDCSEVRCDLAGVECPSR